MQEQHTVLLEFVLIKLIMLEQYASVNHQQKQVQVCCSSRVLHEWRWVLLMLLLLLLLLLMPLLLLLLLSARVSVSARPRRARVCLVLVALERIE